MKVYFTISPKDCLSPDNVFEGYSKRVMLYGEEQDYKSYIESDVKIDVLSDGALSLSDQNSDSSVYFYPDQLKHLRIALNFAAFIAEKDIEEK